MRLLATVTAVGALATAVGCAPSARVGAGAFASMHGPKDARYQLADDSDLAEVRANFEAMPEGAPGRAALRRRLCTEYAHRIDHGFARGHRHDAYAALRAFAGLWKPDELRDADVLARGLAPYRAEIDRVRREFSRTGGDFPATLALVMLRAADPAHAHRYGADIDEIFAFDDELSVDMYGDGAQRARPIAILASVVKVFPTPYAVDRLAHLYAGRQKALSSLFKRGGADLRLIQAHGQGVLRTTWNIVRIFARADRVQDAPRFLAGVVGLGDDRKLRSVLARALAKGAGASDWLALAGALHAGDAGKGDITAALRVDEQAMQRFPKSAPVALAAADAARELGNAPLAIRYYRRGLRIDPDHRDGAEHLAGLYEYRITELALGSRPRAAHRVLETFRALYASASKRWPRNPLSPDLADADATMGRGLVSLGEIRAARAYLDRALSIRPTLTALEYLGTIDLKLDHFSAAAAEFERALALPIRSPEDAFDHDRLLRLAGEAHAGAGDTAKATSDFRAALRRWKQLVARVGDVQPQYMAQILVETGKLDWKLGRKDRALAAFERAGDVDPRGASIVADAVSFLIMRDQYQPALDLYHGVLATHGVGDYFKIYMSLWVLAEARRERLPPDPLATRYLARQDGRLWQDDLARYASGRASLAALERAANTRGRRAELLYYDAVLTEAKRDPRHARALLRRVLGTNMLLFFEYDMAKRWLAAPHRGGRREGEQSE